ncbi:hypothetical protein RN001_006291 [Aquatica leii]|uniref:Zinc finger CCCH-type with G patch domain-containing protein n=1 Tax=Aquatica leii TaxID=1421715 RepID=A0AAN7PD99_9COLE|nr:hypothetical protein RN001_006291 [Aquatica leii]
MEPDILQSYKKQLSEVELALTTVKSQSERLELQGLKENIKQLIELTEESLNEDTDSSNIVHKNDPLADEYALFMAEMTMEGATNSKTEIENDSLVIEEELKTLEGMKCRAPHKHNWGDSMYHNAIVCSVLPSDNGTYEDIKVKIMFINPTHQEMLPCPYLMEGNCKFDDEQCKYSHGEVVLFSLLKEYSDPNFEKITTGSLVLAKQIDKLWSRAKVLRVIEDNCIVKFDSNQKDLKIPLHEVLPLEGESREENSDEEFESDAEDIINISLLTTPTSNALGDWERFTKGVGSKIMQKMGYIVGTGLGRRSNGRIEPVPAVVLPPGKSLDHCMNLREKAGNSKDLFSIEKKLKRLQKKQEKRNLKAYEREKQKVDVFNFLNETLANEKTERIPTVSKSKHRQDIKTETSRNLNVASLKIDEDIKRIEKDLYKIRESLSRHKDSQSQIHKTLKQKLHSKQQELQTLKMKSSNIVNEQSLRNHKKKLTIF